MPPAAGPPTGTPSPASAATSPTAACRSPAATTPPPPPRGSTGLSAPRPAYDAERAHEDPFVLAELRTTGEAFAGQVVSAEPDRTDVTAAGRTVLRPRFTVRTSDPVRLEPGPDADQPGPSPAAGPDQPRSPAPRASTDVVLEVTQGMGTPRKPTPGAVPAARGAGQLHPRPRATSPSGSSRRPTRPRGRTAARPRGRPPTRPRSRSHDRDQPARPGRRDQPGHRQPSSTPWPGQATAASSSTPRPAPGRPRWSSAPQPNWPPAASRCIIVAQTNNQVDDLTSGWPARTRACPLGRLTGTDYTRPRRGAHAAQCHGSHHDR